MDGKIIAFAGKGGSGKTTTTSMVLRQLIATGRKPVLAVDADPNATLAMTLGLEQGPTIADLRDRLGEAAKDPTQAPKQILMDQYLAEILQEEVGFDLLTMGRPEGPSCYCYINGLLRRYLSLLRKSYAYVLVDCEAGMEYLSRLVVDDIETLVLVAEASPVGLTTAERILELADSLKIHSSRRILAVNKVPEGMDVSGIMANLQEKCPQLERVLAIPNDADLYERCLRGEPVDASAGKSSRAVIEELTERCVGANASVASQAKGATP